MAFKGSDTSSPYVTLNLGSRNRLSGTLLPKLVRSEVRDCGVRLDSRSRRVMFSCGRRMNMAKLRWVVSLRA